MLVTDTDLVFKLRSLPFEEREELLRIVGAGQESAEGDAADLLDGETPATDVPRQAKSS